MLFEDQTYRSKLAAEQATPDRNMLSKKLAVKTHEAIEAENRFRHMADLAPTGIFHIDALGAIVYANREYWELTQLPTDMSYAKGWYSVLHEEDHPQMDVYWEQLMVYLN